MKLKTWEIALICAFLTVFVCGFSVQREEAALSGKLVRLHVVANSDSEADQALKLRVRDAVLAYLRPRLEGVEDAQEARRILDGSLEGIVEAAGAVTDGEGAGYGVTASLCRESFPTTQYDNFALPAGEYLSLRVKLGAAAGHNWWCVVFPPICDAGVIDTDTADAIGLTGKEAKLITADGPGYVVKFRLMEWIGSFLSLFH